MEIRLKLKVLWGRACLSSTCKTRLCYRQVADAVDCLFQHTPRHLCCGCCCCCVALQVEEEEEEVEEVQVARPTSPFAGLFSGLKVRTCCRPGSVFLCKLSYLASASSQ